MSKNLILMSALFAGSMIVSSGFGSNLGETAAKEKHRTKQYLCSNVDNDNFGFTAEMISDNKDFKFEDYRSLESFISAYYDNTKAMGLITSDRLSNIDDVSLLKITYDIEGDNALQDQEKELILDKIFTIIANRDFKFENYAHLMDFIETYHKYTKAIDLITPDSLSTINANALLATASHIKDGYYSIETVADIKNEYTTCVILQSHTKELILDTILNIITNRDFKFENLQSLENFIFAYHEHEGVIEFITPDRLSNINTLELLSIAADIKNGWKYFLNLQEQKKEQILNKILNIIIDMDFKFKDYWYLSGFIFAYYGNTKAMDFITLDRLSNMNTDDLIRTAAKIKKGWLCFSNLQCHTKEQILDKIFTILADRNLKFKDRDSLMSFIRTYHE